MDRDPDTPWDEERRSLPRLTRRTFLVGAGGAAAGGALGRTGAADEGAGAKARTRTGARRLEGAVRVALRVNGEEREARVEPRVTLLDLLRVHLDPPLTGAKLVCDMGACGACTVLLDEEPVYACLVLAVDASGRDVRTVEGLATEDELSPVQEAFVANDASMCGFCTPGFVMSVTALLERDPDATLEDARLACSGNLCRCGTQPHLLAAALDAGRRLRNGEER